jgi:hypothetical protein
MVDFTPPFGENGERRLPDSTEQSLGLSCDPQQLRELLNGLFNLHQGQFKAIADEAGVTPAGPGDKTLLNRAVLALIAAATGAGDTSEFVLFTQARARQLVFPEILNTAGTIVVTAPSTGTVRVPAGVTFTHRGIFNVTTVQTDFPTDPSKTYHLRWNPTDGFVLRDLASGVYNPSTLAETNATFDSTYDDMLVARVITNSSNVATITNLVNRNRIWLSGEIGFLASDWPFQNDTFPSGITNAPNVSVNFARTPRAFLSGMNDIPFRNPASPSLYECNVGIRVVSRYLVRPYFQVTGDAAVNGLLAYEVMA